MSELLDRILPESTASNIAREFTCADLFAGAGGLSIGFHEQGFRSLFFNEYDAKAAKTFAHNFPAAVPFVCPIESLTADQVRGETEVGDLDLDVLIGGPPCQGFSINAPERTTTDPRNHLFRHYARLVLEGIRPKVVVLENVPGLASLAGGQTLHDVQQAFADAGYRTIFKILNSAHYGVPEERWRLVFLGTRIDSIELSFPKPIHYSLQRPNFSGGRDFTFNYAIGMPSQDDLFSELLLPPRTVGEAISDLPPIASGGGAETMNYLSEPQNDYQKVMRVGSEYVLNHHCSGMSSVNVDRFHHVPPGGSWRDIPHDLLPLGMQRARRSDHTKRYGRFHKNMVSSTLLTKCDPHWGTFVHYDQDRIISVREAARIQSFPDWFRFLGSKGDQYRQVGNAVPPLMAEAIARHVLGLIERSELGASTIA